MDRFRDKSETVRAMLDEGGVIVYPTETVYGLGADPLQRKAVEKVMALKGRPLHQSPLLLIPDMTWLHKLTREVPSAALRLIAAFWPGPLTIVFEASREIPPWLIRDDETVALRLSSHPWVQAFLAYYQKPIISTSANVSGQPGAATVEMARRYFLSGIDCFVDGGHLSPSRGSTILSVARGVVEWVREGDIDREAIEKAVHG